LRVSEVKRYEIVFSRGLNDFIQKSDGWVATEGVFRGHFQTGTDSFRDRHRCHLPGDRVFADASRGHAAFSRESFVLFPNTDEVAHGFGADFFDKQFHLIDLLEPQWRMEVTRSMNTRPSHAFAVRDLRRIFPDGQLDGAEESMLSALHETKEIREMDDARHVSVRELDAVSVNKAMFSHEGNEKSGRGLIS
jgi:hypothetical protein